MYLFTQLKKKPHDTAQWAQQQGIPTDDDFVTASRHVVYRIIGKLLFYHALSQLRSELKPLVNLQDVSADEFKTILESRFATARKIDYEAVFEPRFPDKVPFSEDAVDVLRSF